jgi:hypothetical protein
MKQLKCSCCGELKDATPEFFYRENRITRCFQYQCKDCKREIDRRSKGSSKSWKEYQKLPRFIYCQLRYQAKKRGITFTLDEDFYYNKLAKQLCHYCGTENTKYWVDRLNNDHKIGYTNENTVACCERCNKMKMHRSKQDFVNHCKKVADFNKIIK